MMLTPKFQRIPDETDQLGRQSYDFSHYQDHVDLLRSINNLQSFYPNTPGNPGYLLTISFPLPNQSQTGVEVDATVPVTGSTVNQERAAFWGQIISSDPNTDAVGGEFKGKVASTNALGRVFGLHCSGEIIAGGVGDGVVTGIECEIVNHGSDQPATATNTSKYGVQVVARFNPLTAGIWFTAGSGGSMHNIIFVDPLAITAGGFVINYPGFFQLDKLGNVSCAAVNCLNVASTASITTANGQVLTQALTVQTAGIVLANGLNSNISWTNSRSRITGPSAGFSIGGFLFPADGERLWIYNSTAQQMTIVNEDASSTAVNRITTLTGGNVVLRAGTSFATFSYDGTDQRWILESTN